MNLKDLEAIIKTKLNYQYAPDEYRTWQYDGFDMSGFNNSAFHNMEILSRFKNYMNPINEENKRNLNFSTVTFWKGTGIIIDVTPRTRTRNRTTGRSKRRRHLHNNKKTNLITQPNNSKNRWPP